MTEKQKRFADEYLKDCNATRAYKAAYPNVKKDSVARVAGARLLTFVNVKNYIDEQLEVLHNERTADAGALRFGLWRTRFDFRRTRYRHG